SLHRWRRGFRDRLERPVVLAAATVRDNGTGNRRAGRAWIRRAHLHPRHEIVHLLVRQLLSWRHLQASLVLGGRDEQALIRTAGNNRRAEGVTLLPTTFPG